MRVFLCFEHNLFCHKLRKQFIFYYAQQPVYVLSQNNEPLYPTRNFGYVRKLLKKKRACIVNMHPFQIHPRPVGASVPAGPFFFVSICRICPIYADFISKSQFL
ncbi:MAG: RRXRR domain-containing protein [Desulfovibrionaceae bacterium]|nr:RRXRR domain-containing protein [Desulfovibrionaceae bacterium]